MADLAVKSTFSGLAVDGRYWAHTGYRMNSNKPFAFYRSDDIYRNYTLADLHIEGDIVNDEVLSQNITRGEWEPSDVTLDAHFSPLDPDLHYDGIRAAMFVGEDSGFVTIGMLFLTDEEQGTVAQSYTTYDSADASNVLIDGSVDFTRENLGAATTDPNRKETFTNHYKFYKIILHFHLEIYVTNQFYH